MTVKRYLGKIKVLNEVIEWKREERQKLEEEIKSMQGIRYDKSKVDKSEKRDGFTAAVIKLMEMSNEIEEFILEKAAVRNRIIEELSMMSHHDELGAKILKMRYVDGKSLEQISVELSYSYIWIRQKHIEAMNLFGELHPEINKK